MPARFGTGVEIAVTVANPGVPAVREGMRAWIADCD
jgi:hypothetical protein